MNKHESGLFGIKSADIASITLQARPIGAGGQTRGVRSNLSPDLSAEELEEMAESIGPGEYVAFAMGHNGRRCEGQRAWRYVVPEAAKRDDGAAVFVEQLRRRTEDLEEELREAREKLNAAASTAEARALEMRAEYDRRLSSSLRELQEQAAEDRRALIEQHKAQQQSIIEQVEGRVRLVQETAAETVRVERTARERLENELASLRARLEDERRTLHDRYEQERSARMDAETEARSARAEMRAMEQSHRLELEHARAGDSSINAQIAKARTFAEIEAQKLTLKQQLRLEQEERERIDWGRLLESEGVQQIAGMVMHLFNEMQARRQPQTTKHVARPAPAANMEQADAHASDEA